MSRHAVRSMARRLLAAVGLVRSTEIERARRAVRTAERERADRAAAAASAKLEALNDKLRAARERAAHEHARHKTVRGLLSRYLLHLARIETDVAGKVALERRVKRAQLAIAVKAARRHGVSPAAAAEAARFAALSHEYQEAASRWQSGDVPGDLQRLTTAGLQWAVPPGTPHTPPPGSRTAESWLPMDDLATVRQFAVGGLMLDIGAGVGTTAIPRVLLGDCVRAYAAEPDRRTYLCLVGNILENHLEGRVLPERLAITGSEGTAPGLNTRKVPALTADGWVQHLGISPDDVRFVRVAMQEWNLHVFSGAGNLLKRRHIVWQIEIQPALLSTSGTEMDDLSGSIARNFTNIKELGRYWADHLVPASETGTVLRALAKERRAANLVLFNLPGADLGVRAVPEVPANKRRTSRAVISLLHTTARLPDGWKPAMEAFLAKARDPKNVEYILAVNEGEEFLLPLEALSGWGRCALVQAGVTGPNSGHNAAAKASRGDILISIADDYFPPDGWDEQIRDAVPDFTQEVVLDVGNSDGSTRLLPFPMLTRKYYDRYGYVFYPGYHGLFGDYEFTEQARRDHVVRPTKHIVFDHRHPGRGTAPMDEAYTRHWGRGEEGKKLFKERKAKGFPKWPDGM